MNSPSPVRVIRFTPPAPQPASATPDATTVAWVLLDEKPTPVGAVERCGAEWRYVLAGERTAIFVSTRSRHDLESQIQLFHFGPLPSLVAPERSLPLAV